MPLFCPAQTSVGWRPPFRHIPYATKSPTVVFAAASTDGRPLRGRPLLLQEKRALLFNAVRSARAARMAVPVVMIMIVIMVVPMAIVVMIVIVAMSFVMVAIIAVMIMAMVVGIVAVVIAIVPLIMVAIIAIAITVTPIAIPITLLLLEVGELGALLPVLGIGNGLAVIVVILLAE